jgi:hypothetical protein
MENNKSEVNKFWIKFHDLVIENGIPEKHADWYVRWGQKFALSIKGKPLYRRTLDDVKAFLSNLQNQENIKPWQVQQARKAIYLLFNKYLNIPLQSSAPIIKEKEKDEIDLSGIKTPALKNEITKKQNDLIEKIKNEIRYRHYSINTEYSYLDWIIRYISFFDGASPETLSASDIRKYLDYLAIKRNVSASTQNQALNAIVFMYTQVLNRDPGDFSDFIRAKRAK